MFAGVNHSPSWRDNKHPTAPKAASYVTRKFITMYCTQQPTVGLCSQFKESCPHTQLLSFLNVHVNLFSHLYLGLASCIFPEVSSGKMLKYIWPNPYLLNATPLPTSFFDHNDRNCNWGVQWIEGVKCDIFCSPPVTASSLCNNIMPITQFSRTL
jgi:hypothetical protein